MQVYRRVWQLYVAHIFLFMVFTAMVSYTLLGSENSLYIEELGVGDFLAVPHVAVMKALVLQFQPTFLDILPLYIVLLASFPVVLLLLRLNALAALLPALALYLLVRVFELNLPGFPEDRQWFFNPFAWQLLFVLGAVVAHLRLEETGPLKPPHWLLWTAVAMLLVSAVVVMSWRLHEDWERVPALFLKLLWPISKTDLAPIRLVHFLSLALVVAFLVPPGTKWLASRWAFPFVLCGRHSLRLAMQWAVNLGGGLLMVGPAALIAWYKDKLGSAVRAQSQEPPLARGLPR